MLVNWEKMPKRKVVSVCEEALNQDKKRKGISLNIPLRFPKASKEKLRKIPFTKISLMVHHKS